MSAKNRNFDIEAAQWDTPPRVKLSKEIVSAILKRIQPNSEWNIMDFGCGTGLLTLQFSALVKSVTAVDSSKGMLDTLKMKTDENNLTNVNVRQVNPDNGGKLEGIYDLILSNMTLHHIKDVQFLISEFYRILNNSGYLCISDLDSDDGQFHSDNSGVFHSGFERGDLQQIFLESGFKNISIETAASVTRPVGNNQKMKEFTIFLICGQKI